MNRTLSLALAALLVSGTAQAQEKWTFALNWFPVGDHAAYWVALDKGYYKAKGLDVVLENSKGSGDTIANANGIDASKVSWVNTEPAAKIAAVVEKRMDGVSDYTTGLPLYEKAG